MVLDDLLGDRPRARSRERLLAGQELVEDDAGREYVGAPVDAAAGDLLGRHVRRRADHGARLRLFRRRAVVGHARDAEIRKLHSRLPVEHDVRGLDVPVHDAALVREVQRIEQLAHDAHRLFQLEALVRIEEILELLALDELHDDVGDLAFLAEVVHLDDVGMVQPRDGLGLAHETHRIFLGGIVVVEMALEDRLDRELCDAASDPGLRRRCPSRPCRALGSGRIDLAA
jgi:hypothetical protein